MNFKNFRLFQLLFFILFINSGVFSQYQKNNIEKRSSSLQKEEKTRETLTRVQMLNTKNNKSLSDKKVLYSIDYVFYDDPLFIDGEYTDSIFDFRNNWVWYEFDEYLNTKAIFLNPNELDYYVYTYDVNNRISSELKYQGFNDYYSSGFASQQKNYKYDNSGRISEIYYESKMVDDNNPNYNSNHKSKVFLVYDGDILKQENGFYWDNINSIWRNGGKTVYEKTSNYEIVKQYYISNNEELVLGEYDSTFFNAANKPKYRLLQRYSSGCHCMLDGAEISYEYLNDTQLIGVHQNFYQIPNSSDYYFNAKYFSSFSYNDNDQLVKYKKFYYNNDSLIFKLGEEETFEYDTIGNIVYWETVTKIRDTLVYFSHIRHISYDYSTSYNNISNNIMKNDDFIPHTNIVLDFNCDPSFYNIKYYDNSFLKPVNAVSKVFTKDKKLKEPFENGKYDYYDWNLKTLNYKHLTAKSFEKPQMSIIPNPTADDLRFFIAEPYDNAIVQIFDISGKLVMEKEVRDNYIDVSVLRSGLYVLRVKTEGGFWTEKFVKK